MSPSHGYERETTLHDHLVALSASLSGSCALRIRGSPADSPLEALATGGHGDVDVHRESVVKVFEVAGELGRGRFGGEALLVPVERDERHDALNLAGSADEPRGRRFPRTHVILSLRDECAEPLRVVHHGAKDDRIASAMERHADPSAARGKSCRQLTK
jgi:hypothetical protein